MTGSDVPGRYVRLCLAVDGRVDGFIDAYFGPAALREDVRAAGPQDPGRLHDEALALLEDVPREGLEDDREAWLVAQIRGIECVTARLAGEEVTWSDEVERCFGIRPHHVDEDVFRESHRRMDDALPGSGDVRDRLLAWEEAANVPREATLRSLEAFGAALRRRTADLVDLPPGERVEYETVTDTPWQAFNDFRGDLMSVIQVNEDLPRSLIDLVDVVAHEAYPGHHTERSCKERLLTRDRSRLETCLTIVASPESMVTEGIATNALEAAIRADGLASLLDEAGDLGVRVDPAVAEVVHVESWNLWASGANVARMLHEDGMSEDEARAYLEEWALYTPDRAAKAVRFLQDADSRAYVTAYTDGRRICRAFIERSPDGFRRLLTEQLTVASLAEANA